MHSTLSLLATIVTRYGTAISDANFSLAVIDIHRPFRFLFDDDHDDEDNDVGFVTNAMFERKTVDKVEHKTATWYSADTNTGIIFAIWGA